MSVLRNLLALIGLLAIIAAGYAYTTYKPMYDKYQPMMAKMQGMDMDAMMSMMEEWIFRA